MTSIGSGDLISFSKVESVNWTTFGFISKVSVGTGGALLAVAADGFFKNAAISFS